MAMNIGNFSVTHTNGNETVMNTNIETNLGGVTSHPAPPTPAPSNNGKRKSVTEENGVNKRKRGKNGEPVVCDNDEVFITEGATVSHNNVLVNLLEEEVVDLKQRFKQIEEILLGHAESKGDQQLKNLVGMLKLSNDKLSNWSKHMLSALQNSQYSDKNNRPAPPTARRRSSARSVAFDLPPQRESKGPRLSRRASTVDMTKNNPNHNGTENNGNSGQMVSKPTYSNVVADNLVVNKQLLNLPRNVGRPRGLKYSNMEEKISQGMEKSSKILSILDFNFGKHISSRDVLLKILDRDLMGFLKKKITEQEDEDVKDDDFYMLNDAIDAISLIEFRGSATVRKTVEDKDKEKYSINTIPINIHFSGRQHRNTFEKYVRIFARHVKIMPYWHPSLLEFKDEIRKYIKKDDNDNLSLKVLNKHVIYGAKKNLQGKWYEAFVYDPLDRKYYISSVDENGKTITGSAKFRKEKKLNKFWSPVRNQSNSEVRASVIEGADQSESSMFTN